jgi:Zn-dependent membrane protease YugP
MNMARLFDYLLFALPGVLITIWAQSRILRAYFVGSRMAAASGRTGGESASTILSAWDLSAIAIEPATGELSNHYDSHQKVLRLSPRVHNGRSLAALAVAAHEAGHAIQQTSRYRGLTVRNLVVPLAAVGSQFLWLFILAGLLLEIDRLILAGISMFGALLILQLANLPTELDASRRGRLALMTTGIISGAEEPIVARVLSATAWTHVALTLTAGLELSRVYNVFK